MGKCSSCEEWNTYQEEVVLKDSAQEEKKKVWKNTTFNNSPQPVALLDIKSGNTQRLVTPDKNLTECLEEE